MKVRYKFPNVENGYICDGYTELVVKDGIFEIEEAELTEAAKILIAAHGGELVKSKAKPKRKNKPVELQKDNEVK